MGVLRARPIQADGARPGVVAYQWWRVRWLRFNTFAGIGAACSLGVFWFALASAGHPDALGSNILIPELFLAVLILFEALCGVLFAVCAALDSAVSALRRSHSSDFSESLYWVAAVIACIVASVPGLFGASILLGDPLKVIS